MPIIDATLRRDYKERSSTLVLVDGQHPILKEMVCELLIDKKMPALPCEEMEAPSKKPQGKTVTEAAPIFLILTFFIGTGYKCIK